jgi:cyclohexanecarboxylate-CoA ligase
VGMCPPEPAQRPGAEQAPAGQQARAAQHARAAQRSRWRAAGWYPPLTLGEACAAAAIAVPDATLTFARRDHETTVRRAELHERARRIAAGLLHAGVRIADRVVLHAPATAQSTAVLEALWLIGAVPVPVVAAAGDSEVRNIVERCDATTLVVSGSGDDGRDDPARIPGVERVVVVDGDERDPLAAERLATHEPLAELPAVDPAAVACVICTSGSTAAPKGVLHSHETLLAGYEPPGSAPTAPTLMAFPTGHIASMLGLVRPLTGGGTVVVMDRWSPTRAVELVEAHRLVSSAGTPFYLSTLLDEAERSGRDISSLSLFLVGAASVPPALVERAEAAGIVAWRSYGSTEHPGITSGLPTDPVERRVGTDGRPGPGNEVRIVDDEGRDVPAGADGEVLARGPRQFLGYDDPALDRASFTGDSWFRTGDVGRLEHEGYLTITDRTKDLVIRGGENVSARAVEDALATHPAVAEVAVCAAPDEVWGERVCAFVRVRDGKAVTLDDLREHVLAAGLGAHHAPEQLEVVEDLPRTATGKVRKVDLRDRLRSS